MRFDGTIRQNDANYQRDKGAKVDAGDKAYKQKEIIGAVKKHRER